MQFLCESCRKPFLSIYSHRDVDQYLCWRCLPEPSKHWHQAAQAELEEYKQQTRLNDIQVRRDRPLF